jgi:hypothetical protein
MHMRPGLHGVGVTQAGMSAEGKPVLDLADIDGAKTGLQGACDAIIGLGKGPNDERSKQAHHEHLPKQNLGHHFPLPGVHRPQHTLILAMHG